MDKSKINEYLNQKGIKVESVFVPFSQSRNKGDKNMSLNWVVTIKKNDRVILSTDYLTVLAYCLNSKQKRNRGRVFSVNLTG